MRRVPAVFRTARHAWNSLVRDWRSGELTVLLLAVVVAVAALTAVGFFTNRVNQAVTLQAAEVLAADLRLQASQPIDETHFAEAGRRGLSTARTLSTLSVVYYGERSQLCSLRMVGEGYPLRGKVRVADRPFEAGSPTDEIPAPGEAWAESRLLAQLDASVGATISVGAATVKITRVLEYRPDRGSGFADLTPDLMMNLADAPATQLLRPGSRATYAALFAGRPSEVGQFRAYLETHKHAGERLRDISEASPQVRSSSDRATRFLNLSALASVLLAAVATAMAARRYVQRHLDQVALMKCMGATQLFILSVNAFELTMLALVSAAAGTVFGYAGQEILVWLLADLIDSELPPPTPDSAYLGLVTALAVLIGFALAPLLQLRRVPPLRVLRRNLEPPPLAYSLTYGLAVVAVLAMLLWLVGDTRMVLAVAGGIAGTLAVLLGAGWLLVKALQPLRSAAGVSWRYGLANVARRSRESIVQVAGFGLGLMVLLLLAVVRNDLLEEWRDSLPADAANHFFINIAPHERAAFQEFFTQRGLPAPALFPMTRARLTHINGKPVEQMKFGTDRAQNFAEREQNLSWAQHPQSDNRIVAGRWWTDREHGQPLISVATEYRDELNLRLGDRMSFAVAGETLDVRIASFREVQWDRFQPNFFLVLPPGLLEEAAGTYMTSLRLAGTQKVLLGELVRSFPAVSVFDIDALLAQVRELMNKAASAVQYVFVFTLLAGVTVLLAAVQSTQDERRYESAVLRTLGASRRTVLQGVAAEFIAIGLLAGTLAAFGATVAGYFIATRLFELEYGADLYVWLWGLIAGAVLVGLSGLLATRSVVNHPPAATLRQTG